MIGINRTRRAEYRYDALDGVRGLAAQVVVIGHLGGLALPEPSPYTLSALGWSSRLAVMVFFVLSGFVIARSLKKLMHDEGREFLLHYAVHRWARIFPPLALAVATTFAVGSLASTAGLPLPGLRSPEFELSLLAFLRGITLTFATTDATFALDGPLWSLRQEVWLYFLAALAALAAARTGLVRLMAGALVLAMVMVTSSRFFYLQSLALFGAGGAVSLLSSSPLVARLARSAWTAFGTVLLLALPLVLWKPGQEFGYAYSNDPLFLAYQAALGIPIALVLLGIATSDGPVSRAFSRWRWVGAFSYTLYVLHNPVLVLIYALLAHFGFALHHWTGAFWAASAVLIVEVLAYSAARLVERPRAYRELAWRALKLARGPAQHGI